MRELIAFSDATPPASIGGADLAASMMLKGAMGALAGAASSPRGREGIWGAAGFVAGVMAGEVGIVGVLVAAMWKKADR